MHRLSRYSDLLQRPGQAFRAVCSRDSCLACLAVCLHMPRLPAERGVDTSAVQRVERPTRDILVTRSPEGDREFAGFGKVGAGGKEGRGTSWHLAMENGALGMLDGGFGCC
jgi:hypothetical protein